MLDNNIATIDKFEMDCIELDTGKIVSIVFKLDMTSNEMNYKADRVCMKIHDKTFIIQRSEFKKMFKTLRKVAHSIYDIQTKAEEIVFEEDGDILDE